MFIFLVKEMIELKRSRVTYFRKAKLHYKGRNSFLKDADKNEIERTDIGYKAFKDLRGYAPYFQFKKKCVMAQIRQLGSPQIFLTLSSAEVRDTLDIH